jgi:hypothetical protein
MGSRSLVHSGRSTTRDGFRRDRLVELDIMLLLLDMKVG